MIDLTDVQEPEAGLLDSIDFTPTEEQELALRKLQDWVINRPRDIAIPACIQEVFYDNPADFFVLRGVAGSGKTSLTSYLLAWLHDQGYNVAVAAPTNKAVGVLAEKVNEFVHGAYLQAEFASIHSFCGLRMQENDDGTHRVVPSGYARLGDYHFVIVDEASMVDSTVLLAQIQANRDRCRVIFVGDNFQLPPVGEAQDSPVFDLPIGAKLQQVTRQAAGNPLIRASMLVREKIAQNERVEASDLAKWLPDNMLAGSKAMINAAIAARLEGKDARILAYRNAAVVGYNERIHYALYPDADDLFVPGERVVVQSASQGLNIGTGTMIDLRTSEELDVIQLRAEKHDRYKDVSCWAMLLRNDLGQEILLYVPKSGKHFDSKVSSLFNEVNDVKRERDKGRASDRDYKDALAAAWAFKKAFCEVRHTYASTVHKAQGSTYDIAFIDLPDLQAMRSVFEYNRALYVALTRPRFDCYTAF